MYYYDVHVHTSDVSRCGRLDARGQVRYYKSIGADGICITDHFFNGNTLVPKNIPWEDKVAFLYKGYDSAKDEGDKTGLTVISGWEYSYHGNDFLTYGLDREWLLMHPCVMDMTLPEYCAFVRSEGGIIVHAHPFRCGPHIDMIRLLPDSVDAVETFNSCRPDYQNRLADSYANEFNLPKICSSDNHFGHLPQIALMGFEKRISDTSELISAIKYAKKDFKIIKSAQGE